MSDLLDLHVYTNNSREGKDKISFLCETAAEKNIRAVAFTDMIEIGHMNRFDLKRLVRHVFFDISKAKQLFFDSLSVFAGLELHQAFADPEEAEKVVSSQHFDLILTAVSGPAPGERYALSPDMPQAEFAAFAEEYCGLLARTVNETDFDVLSRLLAPLRGTRNDYSYLEQLLHPVLSALAAKEKALEVNTRDLLGSERIRDLYLRLVEFFLQAGGKYVTFGSESFTHDELGAGIELAMSAVKRAGFRQFTFYDGRIPYTVDL